MILGAAWCQWIGHTGAIISSGKVEVICKKNMKAGAVTIPGRWWIRKCSRCKETFSHPYDLIDRRKECREVMKHAG
jgi:hypothetical protein